MNKDKILLLAQSAVFASLICLSTMFLHIPIVNGYVHLGDGLIYIAAMTLPLPYALCASAVGACFADAFSGYVAYVIPTLLIKSVNVLCFSAARKKSKKLVSARSVAASVLSGLVTIAGYFAADAILWGNPLFQLARTVPANAVQALFASAVFVALGSAIEKIPKNSQ